MTWKTLLAYISGSIDEELIKRNEYLAAENRILRSHIEGRLRLTNPERITLAKLGKNDSGDFSISTIERPYKYFDWTRWLRSQNAAHMLLP